MKKLLVVLLVLVALSVAAIFWTRPTAVVVPVTAGKAVQAVPGSVTVYAEFKMEVKSEVGGRIVRSDLDPGRHFAKGDFMLQLDPEDLQLEIDRTEAEYEAAKKRIAVGSAIALELATARENLAVYERQAKLGGYPLGELEKQKRNVQTIEQRLALEDVDRKQQLESYENTLKVKRRQLEKMTIRAPADGVVSEVMARVGDLIGGSAPLATLISDGRTVEARISEENFAGIKLGQKASVRFLSYGGYLFDATITKILPTADPLTQRYVVHLKVEIERERLKPGMTGEVSVVVGERDAKALVPPRAIMEGSVYVVADGRVQRRAVKLGYSSINMVEVTEGLKPGEQVIVDDLDRFHDGQRVSVRLAE